MSDFNITDHFKEVVGLHPERIALLSNQQQLSFSDFDQLIDETVAYFQQKGIRKGMKVLVLVPVSIDLYRSVLALFRMGAIAVFIDEWVGMKRLKECCTTAKCEAMIGPWKVQIISLFVKELRQIPIHLKLKTSSVSKFDLEPTTREDIALITFTTGSTGKPKGAIRTHGALDAQFKELNKLLDAKESDIDLTLLPIVLLLNLGSGVTSVLCPIKMKNNPKQTSEDILNVISKFKVNRITASPQLLLDLADSEHSENYNRVRKIFTGGAPVFPRHAEKLRNTWTNAKITIVFGSTEAEPISHINSDELIEKGLKNGLPVGRPVAATELKIIKYTNEPLSITNESELQKLERDSGEVGEIIVAGNHVLDTYLDNEEAIRRNKLFVNGKCWHRTGDSAYLNAEGELFLTGRCDSLFYRNETLIRPFIIEGQLEMIEGVERGTLMEINHEALLVVQRKSDSDEQTLTQELEAAFQDLYDRLVYMDEIPRDPRHRSKIDYGRLSKNCL